MQTYIKNIVYEDVHSNSRERDAKLIFYSNIKEWESLIIGEQSFIHFRTTKGRTIIIKSNTVVSIVEDSN